MNMRTLSLALVAAGLAISACTRSATTPPPPTPTTDFLVVQPPADNPNYPPPVETLDPMLVIGTQMAAEQTQVAGGGTGEQPPAETPTEAAPVDVSGAAQPTATPIVAAPPGVNPPPPVPQPTAAAPGATAAPPAATCASPYTVKAGEWIYQIARQCGLDPRAVIAANPGINPSRLAVGQVINLPGAAPVPQPTVAPQPTAAPTAVACTGTYTVKPGDTFFRIAFNCNLTVAQLATANPGVNIYLIRPGQVIKFP